MNLRELESRLSIFTFNNGYHKFRIISEYDHRTKKDLFYLELYRGNTKENYSFKLSKKIEHQERIPDIIKSIKEVHNSTMIKSKK